MFAHSGDIIGISIHSNKYEYFVNLSVKDTVGPDQQIEIWLSQNKSPKSWKEKRINPDEQRVG